MNWDERFRLNAARLLGSGEQVPEGEEVAVEAAATCTHLFQREQDEMRIGLSTCSVELRL